MGDGKKTIPLRRCSGCVQMIPKQELIRVVREGEEVSVDLTGKKPGRGTYVCRNKGCIVKAEKKRGVERSLKSAVPKEVYEALKSLIEKEEMNG